jgi:uncharacterized protein (TIGR03067 family)
MSLPVLLLLAVPLIGVEPAASEANKKELDKLQGVWRLQARQDEGRDDKPRELGSMTVTITGNKFKSVEDGETTEGSLAIDAGKKPAAVDMVPSRGKEEKLLGIYQLEGDILKVCYARPGADRPTEFATKEKSRQVLLTFKKEAKKE